MKRLHLLTVFALVALVVGGFFAAREVAQSSNTAGMSSLASPAPGGATLTAETPSFSVGRSGPSALSPADIFNLGPAVSIPCAGLGLAATGDCLGPTGPQDNVDALSYGMDFTVQARQGNWLSFSVGAGSTGLAGTAVRGEATCATAEPEADEFASAANATNSQYYDGNGAACDANAGGPIGLIEARPAAPHNDNLDALDEFPGPQIAYGGGAPNMVWFSLDPASPSLGAIGAGASPDDILVTVLGVVGPMQWATAANLGLVGGPGGDDIDALCIHEGSPAADYYRPGVDLVWFSLAPGSPTLGAPNNWSAADILQAAAVAGQPPTRVVTAGQLGLNATDNLDALKCLVKIGVGGIAELPDVAGASAGEAGASAGGSGWSAGGYAALAGGLAAAVVALSAGAWYARRRFSRS
jgi:hypothetical protein